jgi:hypothetical protein
MIRRRTVKLSRPLKCTTLGGGMAESTNLIRKIVAIQPVGWSALLAANDHLCFCWAAAWALKCRQSWLVLVRTALKRHGRDTLAHQSAAEP